MKASASIKDVYVHSKISTLSTALSVGAPSITAPAGNFHFYLMRIDRGGWWCLVWRWRLKDCFSVRRVVMQSDFKTSYCGASHVNCGRNWGFGWLPVSTTDDPINCQKCSWTSHFARRLSPTTLALKMENSNFACRRTWNIVFLISRRELNAPWRQRWEWRMLIHWALTLALSFIICRLSAQ